MKKRNDGLDEIAVELYEAFVQSIKRVGVKKTLEILSSTHLRDGMDSTAYDLLVTVCDEFNVTPESVLISKDKRPERYYATAVYCYLLKNKYDYKVKTIIDILKKSRVHCYRLIHCIENLNAKHKSIAWVVEKKAKLETITHKLN